MLHSSDFRPTVAGLVLRPVNPVSSPYPPVLLQWPSRAAEKGEGNLATPQGGIIPGEDKLTAMKRELREEHGLRQRQCRVFPILHRPFMSPETHKSYVWFLVICDDPVALVPDPSEVAAASWYYCPQTLFTGVRQQMHKGKARMFSEVFVAACEQHPDFFGDYVPFVARRRRRVEQVARHRLAKFQHA